MTRESMFFAYPEGLVSSRLASIRYRNLSGVVSASYGDWPLCISSWIFKPDMNTRTLFFRMKYHQSTFALQIDLGAGSLRRSLRGQDVLLHGSQ